MRKAHSRKHNTMYQRFRWTPKNAPVIAFWGLAVPFAAFFAFSKTNVRMNMAF